MTLDEVGGDLGVTAFSERYRLGEVLGVGGAATVYRAWDRRMNRHVAVKIYSAGVAATERLPHRAEVAALARLRHPGLVALYDAGVDSGHAYLVMQLIDGEPLSQRVKREPLPTDTVVDLGARLAATLAHVHDQGVIHRDVKPANVLVDDEDRPYLADFGVSLLVDATRSTTTGLVLGTPAFLAPEQVRGQEVGPAADVYALGLVLLEALTGRREYPGGAVESAVARLHRSPEIPADLPDGLRSLLVSMTAMDVAARPDAAEVATRLARPASDDAVPVPAPVTAEVPVPSRSRHGRRVLGTLVAAAAAVTVALTTVGGAAPDDPGTITTIDPSGPGAAGTPAAQSPSDVQPTSPPPQVSPPSAIAEPVPMVEQVAVSPARAEATGSGRAEATERGSGESTTAEGERTDGDGAGGDGAEGVRAESTGTDEQGESDGEAEDQGNGGEKNKGKAKGKNKNNGSGSDD